MFQRDRGADYLEHCGVEIFIRPRSQVIFQKLRNADHGCQWGAEVYFLSLGHERYGIQIALNKCDSGKSFQLW